MQQVRANTKRKKVEIDDKHAKVDNCNKRIEDLTSTLEEIESQKLNIEERTKRLEKMIEVYLFCIKVELKIVNLMVRWRNYCDLLLSE